MEDSPVDNLGSVKGETPEQFAALVQYAQMKREGDAEETRSLRKLATSSKHKFETLGKWSSKFDWVKRVAEYDLAWIEWRAKQWEARRLAVDDNDYQDGKEMRELARLQLKKDRETLEAGDSLGTGEGRRMIVEASKMQRLASGAPTERTEQQYTDDYFENLKLIWMSVGKKEDGQKLLPD